MGATEQRCGTGGQGAPQAGRAPHLSALLGHGLGRSLRAEGGRRETGRNVAAMSAAMSSLGRGGARCGGKRRQGAAGGAPTWAAAVPWPWVMACATPAAVEQWGGETQQQVQGLPP